MKQKYSIFFYFIIHFLLVNIIQTKKINKSLIYLNKNITKL